MAVAKVSRKQWKTWRQLSGLERLEKSPKAGIPSANQPMIPSDARPMSGSFFAELARLASRPLPEQAGIFLVCRNRGFGRKHGCITLSPGT
jgi:hypothetical protein